VSVPYRSFHVLLCAVSLLMLAILAGCEEGAKRGAGAGPPQMQTQMVRTAAVERGRAIDYFRTVAEIRAQERVQIASEVAGKVETVPVEDGTRVDKGDILVRLDAETEKANVTSAEATLYERQQNLERANELARKGFATEARVETAKARLRAAEAQLERVQKELADRTIRAPFAGEVGLIDVSPGDFVDAGESLFELVMTESLRVRFSVPQALIAALRTGKSVLVSTEGRAAESVSAVIRSVAPRAEEATRSFQAEAELPADAPFKPGTFVTVRLPVETRENALFVPEAAIQRQAVAAYVFRVTGDDRVERVRVTTGILREGMVEVSGNLSASDEIVVSGLQKITGGEKIRRAGSDHGEIAAAHRIGYRTQQ
jgi:membrane fusion protein, multidrug efflux system